MWVMHFMTCLRTQKLELLWFLSQGVKGMMHIYDWTHLKGLQRSTSLMKLSCTEHLIKNYVQNRICHWLQTAVLGSYQWGFLTHRKIILDVKSYWIPYQSVEWWNCLIVNLNSTMVSCDLVMVQTIYLLVGLLKFCRLARLALLHVWLILLPPWSVDIYYICIINFCISSNLSAC